MIDGVGTASSTAGTSSTSAKSSAESADVVGKDDFFKMLIAQIKYQDPLNPQDGAAFAAQLAQFSSLEQLTSLNETLAAQSTSYSQLMNLQSVGLIGKEVEANAIDPETSASVTVTGEVTAVQFRDNAIYLTVNDQEVAFDNLVSVK